MWIHEDDWAMISIEPIENAGERAATAVKLAEFSEAHRAPGGIGWTDMMVVPPPPVSIATRGIALAELVALLGVAEVEPLATGYSSTSEPVANGFAFRASSEPYGTGSTVSRRRAWSRTSTSRTRRRPSRTSSPHSRSGGSRW